MFVVAGIVPASSSPRSFLRADRYTSPTIKPTPSKLFMFSTPFRSCDVVHRTRQHNRLRRSTGGNTKECVQRGQRGSQNHARHRLALTYDPALPAAQLEADNLPSHQTGWRATIPQALTDQALHRLRSDCLSTLADIKYHKTNGSA